MKISFWFISIVLTVFSLNATEKQIREAWKSGQFEQATAMALQIAENETLTPAQRLRGYRLAVDTAAKASDIQSAEKYARAALNLSGQNFGAWCLIADVRRYKGDREGVFKAYDQILEKDHSPAIKRQVDRLKGLAMIYYYEHEKAFRHLMESGNESEAARQLLRFEHFDRAYALFRQIAAGEKYSMSERTAAFDALLYDPASFEFLQQHLSLADENLRRQKNYVAAVENYAVKFMDYSSTARLARLLRPHLKDPGLNFEVLLYEIRALAASGDIPGAVSLAAEPKSELEPGKQLILSSIVTLLNEKTIPASSLSAATRAQAIAMAGKTAVAACENDAAAVAAREYDNLIVRPAVKTYLVPYAADWRDCLAQYLDRSYQGPTDFLETDVSTGNRGGNIAQEPKGGQRPAELRIWGSEKGLNIMLEAFDPQAAEVQAQLRDAGSYEIYLAPGSDAPYYCLLLNLNSGKLGVWNTAYDYAGHRRLPEASCEHSFHENGYRSIINIPWSYFYDRLPVGSEWEFEVIHWSSAGGRSWNGVKVIHGRSTWGRLAFNFSGQQWNKIRRPLLFEAYASYRNEKRITSDGEGIIEFYSDPEIGDVKFYETCILPLIQELDKAGSQINGKMNEQEVNELYGKYMKSFREFRFIVTDLRRNYLAKLFTE